MTNDEIAEKLAESPPASLEELEPWLVGLSDHDAECWRMYFDDILPAGGLWLSFYRYQCDPKNPLVHPRKVAEGLNDPDGF